MGMIMMSVHVHGGAKTTEIENFRYVFVSEKNTFVF